MAQKAIKHTKGNALQLSRESSGRLEFQVIGDPSSREGKELARALQRAVDGIPGFGVVKFNKGKVILRYDSGHFKSIDAALEQVLIKTREELGQNTAQGEPYSKTTRPPWMRGGDPDPFKGRIPRRADPTW